jgi:aspartate/methionine/tyrosine aminotransferase
MDVMREANARAAAGESVLHLEVGQPSTPAPKGVVEAARRALAENRLGYTEAFGMPELRERIVRHYRNVYGVEVPTARVVVTTGSSSGFVLAFLAAFDVGDRVALAVPGYPAYRNILAALGIEPVLVEAGSGDRFQPTPEVLDRLGGRLDGLIVASPANPTGSMIPRADLERLAAHCRMRGIRLVSDEIYHGIVFGPAAETALAFDPEAIVINSFSKYYSMTGWRLGWMVVPESLARAVECLTQNLYISPPTLSQIAGIAAFDCAVELDANVARYAENRRLLLAELPKAGFDKFAPADGAFYLYADVGAFTNDSAEFCRRMLAETGVAATPGLDFDPGRGNRFMRFSIAGATADMAEAARRLVIWRK